MDILVKNLAMKKYIVLLASLSFSLAVYAQEEESNKITDKGTFVIDANTTVGNVGGSVGGGGTSFLLTSGGGETIWNLGAEMGYFFDDDLAAKVGFGYGDYAGNSVFSYKFGLKYYIIGVIPAQLDISGQGSEDFYGAVNPAYLGLQAGYAVFLGEMVSLEPALRYNISLNDSFDGLFQIQVGFSMFF